MSLYVESYKDWHKKTIKSILCSRQPERLDLLHRFENLELRETLLGVRQHASKLLAILKEYQNERKNLRWLEKLTSDCERQVNQVESVLKLEKQQEFEIVRAVAKDEIDIELAIGLMQ